MERGLVSQEVVHWSGGCGRLSLDLASHLVKVHAVLVLLVFRLDEGPAAER
jgi:hypothetical protein